MRSCFKVVCAGVLLTAASAAAESSTTVRLADAQGKQVGTATLTQAPGGGVSVAFDLKGLPPGEHGVHFHETPTCTPPSFESAGDHFNPSGKQHGDRNAKGPHVGDVGNVVVASDGTAKTTLVARHASLTEKEKSVAAGSGTSLVIHAARDDMATDPSGNSGARIACGIVKH